MMGWLWGRKWLILASFVLVTTATIVVASRLPDRFRATTLILITPPQLSQEYVRATVTDKIADRLPSISQEILSRSRLERIIKDFNLYTDRRGPRLPEAAVELMRADIQVETVERSDSFRVSYQSSSPVLAMQVTERLAGLFIEENLHDRAVLARSTSEFLGGQLEDARRRLVEQERRLEAYRLAHVGEMPTQLQPNLQVIQSTQAQLQALSEALNRDRDRRMLVERQLADSQPEGSAERGATAVDAAGVAAQGTSAAARLNVALAELAALELQMTPRHPDVLRAKNLVARLEGEARKEAAHVPTASAIPQAPTAAEIAMRSRVKELGAERESLDRQIAHAIEEEGQLRETLETYRSRVDAVPRRESELASLTRDYETLQSRYKSLLTKEEDSKMAENLERHQVGEQFKIVDPPGRPQKPYWPNRRLIDLGGAAGGLAFGVGLALALAFFDKSLRTETDVQAALDLPLLALVPPMMSRAVLRRARWQKAAYSLAFLMVFGMCATAVWLTFRI
jgi:polysaccharide chain length determinant protein (PEP-CTERM system associated)